MTAKNDRGFTHPDFGTKVQLEQDGCEVRLTFFANSEAKAADLANTMLDQLKSGAINLTLMGKPTKVTER